MENTKPSLTRNPMFILGLGVFSLLILQIAGPVAWILGNRKLQTMPLGTPQRGLVVAGRIMGAVATALFVLSILIVIVKFIIPGI